jgi:hypothetical protein
MEFPKKVRSLEDVRSVEPAKGTFTKKDQTDFLWRELRERMVAVAPVRRRGPLARFFGWLSSVFSSVAERLCRREEEGFPDLGFSTSDEFLEDCWQMIRDTEPNNLVIMHGESREEAVRRVIAERLAVADRRRRAEFEQEHGAVPPDVMLGGLDGEWHDDSEPADPGECCHGVGCAHGRKVFGAADPMLDAVRRERLKALLRKKDISEDERDELGDLLSRIDEVIVLEEEEGDRRGLGHPEH